VYAPSQLAMLLRGRMCRMNKAVIILGVSLILLTGAEAVADDPVMIRMYNDDVESIELSVYDMNTQPPDALIADQRVDGFAWIPISVTAGPWGRRLLRSNQNFGLASR
jgi:hypothetical protein